LRASAFPRISSISGSRSGLVVTKNRPEEKKGRHRWPCGSFLSASSRQKTRHAEMIRQRPQPARSPQGKNRSDNALTSTFSRNFSMSFPGDVSLPIAISAYLLSGYVELKRARILRGCERGLPEVVYSKRISAVGIASTSQGGREARKRQP